MDYKTQKNQNYFLYDTQVENLFIGEYMLSAPGDYVKVYLLALMFARLGEPVDSLMLAKQLSCSADTVDKAWDYWASIGVARKLPKENTEGYLVEILNMKEAIFGHCAMNAAVSAPALPRIIMDNEELSGLYDEIQKTAGRLLEAREPELVASWISEFGIAPDVILKGYKYCAQKGRSTRPRYVEKILLDWRERGLTSASAVDEFLAETDKQYELFKRVFREMGFRRNPTEPEKTIMNKWFSDMNFSLDKVLEACRKTSGVPNPSINYLDSILTSWYREAHSDASEIEENAYSKIQALYERRRKENSEKTSRRRAEIFTALPRLGEIMDEQKSLGYGIAKAMLSKTGELENIRKKQKALEEEKAELLAKAGYAPDALNPVYSCSKCQDTGIMEDGTTCSCYAQMLILVKQ